MSEPSSRSNSETAQQEQPDAEYVSWASKSVARSFFDAIFFFGPVHPRQMYRKISLQRVNSVSQQAQTQIPSLQRIALRNRLL
jgi:hypothetical protein